MSVKRPTGLYPLFALTVLAITTVALIKARSGSISNPPAIATSGTESSNSPTNQDKSPQAQVARSRSSSRNLSGRPEAFNFARRMGQRFAPGRREQSITIGTVTFGSERKTVHTVRRQTDDGERVEISIAGTPGSFTWDADRGAKSSGKHATGTERQLIERLVLDGPDQFVLAQLRGASYYFVARNVRPADANDGYAGPLWNIVRVDDPQPDMEKRPESRWRLYYLNSTSGLIDRIISEVRGQQIVAELTWTESNGEKVPTQIVWSRSGTIIMQYNLTNFSHTELEGAR